MNITNARYLKYVNDDNTIVEGSENTGIVATIDGIISTVPLNLSNRHYAEIMRQVESGELTIADAD